MNTLQTRRLELRDQFVLVAQGDPDTVICGLSPADASVLVSSSVKHSDAPYQTVLRYIWQKRAWLVCPCQPDKSDRAIMHVRRSFDGIFTLVRSHDKQPHTSDCPFYVIPPDRTPSEHIGRLSLTARVALDIVRSADLYSLCSDDLHSPDLVNMQYTRLRLASSVVLPKYGLLDSHAFVTHPKAVGRLFRTLRAQAQSDSSHKAAQGILTVVTGSLARSDLENGLGLKISESVRIERPSINRTKIQGPWLCFAMIALNESSREYGAVRIFAVPVYTKRFLMPVPGESSRDLLRKVTSIQDWLSSKRGLRSEVRFLGFARNPGVAEYTLSLINAESQATIYLSSKPHDGNTQHSPGDSENNPLSPTQPFTSNGDRKPKDNAFGRVVIARLLSRIGT